MISPLTTLASSPYPFPGVRFMPLLGSFTSFFEVYQVTFNASKARLTSPHSSRCPLERS